MRVNIKEFLYKYRSAEYRYGIFIPEDIPAFFNFHAVRIANYISDNAPKKKRHQYLMDILKNLKDCKNRMNAHIAITELINKNLTE
jgi:hypothetical protein